MTYIVSDLKSYFEQILNRHQYALGYDGFQSDGDFAWLSCTCGWEENYEMPEDDLSYAERRWNEHLAASIAADDWNTTLIQVWLQQPPEDYRQEVEQIKVHAVFGTRSRLAGTSAEVPS